MARTNEAFFADRRAAQRAVVDLEAAGFESKRITLSRPVGQSAFSPLRRHAVNSTVGAVIGSLVLGTIGALIGWAADLALLNPPGDTILLVVAIAIVGGMVGWLTGGLVLASLPATRKENREDVDDQGGVVLTVQAGGRQAVAQHILARNGGRNLQTHRGVLPTVSRHRSDTPPRDRTPAAS
ncbi:MAG: hypothetical protein ACRDHP_10405 [Ktedonobacterales bacterium]